MAVGTQTMMKESSNALLFDNLPRLERRLTAPPRSRPRIKTSDEGCHPWPLQHGINVVLFAGMGGACQGIERTGSPVHVAVNHDRIAIAAHKALNPHTRHIQADIYEVCPLEATGGRYVAGLWASPDCRDHSVAKGGAPRSPRVRSMPWQVCRWVGVLEKRGKGVGTVFLENVREIRGWGPLIAKRDKATGRVIKLDGTVAAKGERVPVQQQQLVRDKRYLGRTYRAWVKHMRGLRKNYEDRDLCCADYGVPTIRKRLFGIATSGLQVPRWPVATHAHRNSQAVKEGRLLPHVPAWSFIDWSIPMRSIFDRDKDLAAATLKRVAVGTVRYVVEAEKPFLIHMTHHGERPPVDGDDAAPTFTGAHRGEVALVAPVLTGCGGRAGQSPPRSVEESMSTSTTKADQILVAAHVTKFRAGQVGSDMQESLATVTANGFTDRPGGAIPLGVVGAHLTKFNENSIGQSAADSIDTLMAGAPRFGVVGAHMIQAGYGEREGQDARCLDMDNSLGTIVAGGVKHAVCGVHMVGVAHGDDHKSGSRAYDAEEALRVVTGSQDHAIVGVHMQEMRTRSVGGSVEDGAPTQTGKPHHFVTGAWMVQHNTGVVGHPMEDGLSTMTSGGTDSGFGGAQQQLVGAYMVHQRGTSTASSPEDAVRALTTGGDQGGDHVGVAGAFLHYQYSSGGMHSDAAEPAYTTSTVDRAMVTTAEMSPPPLSPALYAKARRVAEFLRSHGVWNGGEIVTVGPYVIIDLLMRMLTGREAAAAHQLDLPATIRVFEKPKRGATLVDPDAVPDEFGRVWIDRPLTKTETFRLVGNSVPRQMGELLWRANVPQAFAEAAE